MNNIQSYDSWIKQLYRMNRWILFFLLCYCGTAPGQPSLRGKVLLAVFAHPDDEETIGPVLAKYASEGATVYLVVATDGRLGKTSFFPVRSPDSLASIRQKEIRCAAEQLGIAPPILLGLPDAFGAAQDSIHWHLDSSRKAITRLFSELAPDVIITWGASGWTRHPDHRMIGDVVTEVFLSRQWPTQPKLYYGELPTGHLPANGPNFVQTDPAYLTVQVKLSADDLAKSKKGWLCHKSQFTEKTVNRLHPMLWKPGQALAFFRPFVLSSRRKTTLF